jgi:hypothetical protein
VNPYGGGDAAYVLSGVLGFCKDTYSLNTVYSLGGSVDSVLCCRNRRRRSIYYFTSRRFLTVTYLDSISVSVSKKETR